VAFIKGAGKKSKSYYLSLKCLEIVAVSGTGGSGDSNSTFLRLGSQCVMEEIAQPEPHNTSMSSTRSILSIRELERNLEPEELKLSSNYNTLNPF